MVNASGYVATQDAVIRDATEIILRLTEVAASALDVSKNTADRQALETEFTALEIEFTQIAERRYNDMSLWGIDLEMRTTIDLSGSSITLSAIDLDDMVIAMSVSQLADASLAVISLTARLASINVFKGSVGNYQNRIDRTIDFTRTHINNLAKAENAIRNIDLAVEAGKFTQQQVLVAASQSILATANGIVNSALQFLG